MGSGAKHWPAERPVFLLASPKWLPLSPGLSLPLFVQDMLQFSSDEIFLEPPLTRPATGRTPVLTLSFAPTTKTTSTPRATRLPRLTTFAATTRVPTRPPTARTDWPPWTEATSLPNITQAPVTPGPSNIDLLEGFQLMPIAFASFFGVCLVCLIYSFLRACYESCASAEQYSGAKSRRSLRLNNAVEIGPNEPGPNVHQEPQVVHKCTCEREIRLNGRQTGERDQARPARSLKTAPQNRRQPARGESFFKASGKSKSVKSAQLKQANPATASQQAKRDSPSQNSAVKKPIGLNKQSPTLQIVTIPGESGYLKKTLLQKAASPAQIVAKRQATKTRRPREVAPLARAKSQTSMMSDRPSITADMIMQQQKCAPNKEISLYKAPYDDD